MNFYFFNPNIMKNIIFHNFVLGFTIKYISILFNLIIKIYFYKFLKKLILKMLINIFLKYINSNIIIIFDIKDNI